MQPLTVLSPFAGGPEAVQPVWRDLVNPTRHVHVRAEAGRRFLEWLTSREGQEAIAAHQVRGQQFFFPNYREFAQSGAEAAP
jgi:tungstate transport system substrate-binding protein